MSKSLPGVPMVEGENFLEYRMRQMERVLQEHVGESQGLCQEMVAAMDRTDVGPVSDKALLLTKKLSAVIGLAREHKSIKWVLSRAGDLKLPFTQSVESRAPTGNVMIDNFVMIRKVSWDEMWHIVYKAGKRETYQRVSQEDARKFEAALPFRKGGHSGA
jgi:hypothetical protein